LEGLLKGIVQAYEDGTQAGLNGAITKAREELGLQPSRQTPFEAATTPSGTSRDSGSNASRSLCTSSSSASEGSGPISTPAFEHGVVDLTREQSGRFSPRLDYAVLATDPDRSNKIFAPPSDIMPYVGKGEYRVAGRIMWACLEYGHRLLKKTIASERGYRFPSEQDTESDPDGAGERVEESHGVWQRALGHSKPLQDLAYLEALLDARLEFRRLGYMSQDTPPRSPPHAAGQSPPARLTKSGTDEAARQLVEGQVIHGLMARGVNLNDHWTALEIEQYIRVCVGRERFAALQQALTSTLVHPLQSQQVEELESIRMLANSLASRAVCFGDGPRWYCDNAKALVDACFPT
jgi:hypothetical protein